MFVIVAVALELDVAKLRSNQIGVPIARPVTTALSDMPIGGLPVGTPCARPSLIVPVSAAPFTGAAPVPVRSPTVT